MRTSKKAHAKRMPGKALTAAVACLLTALLACYGCAPSEDVDNNDAPLSSTANAEQDAETAKYTQTLDDGIVVSSDGLDVTNMDISFEPKEVKAPKTATLPDEATDTETATGSVYASDLLTAGLAGTSSATGTPSTVGGLTVIGGTVGTDFTHAANTVVIKKSGIYSLAGTFTGTVQVEAGVDAWIILNGVTITANNASSPINLLKGATAHIVLADGTTNTLNANQQGCAAIHCGDGSTLYIDDSVVNYDFSAKKHIDTLYGKVDTTGTATDIVKDQDISVSKGDVISKLETKGVIGKLIAKGGKSAAGIGAGPKEVAGTMVFDGGYIEAYSWGGHSNNYGNNNAAIGTGVTNAEGVNQGDSSGTGIGGGAGGGGATQTTFNGGTIYAFGSYHGAGIGAGWSSAGSMNAQTGASAVTRNANNCGNININGGYILSQGYAHGNAFGGACGTNMTNMTCRITGGTLRPFSHSSRADIGGSGGFVIIDGGSISLSGAQSAKFMSSNNKAYSDVARTQEVVPVEVDLSAQTGTVDFNITDWTLLIDGKVWQYGAPSKFNAGKLTLWLPPTAKTQKVEVQLNYYDSKKGSEVLVEPLYREAGSTSSNVKRNVYFDMPYKAVFGDAQIVDETVPQITNFPNELLVDGKVPASVKTLIKEYDGLPFKTATVSDLSITESISKETRKLTKNDLVTYSYRLLNGNTFSDELSAAQMPSDTGLMAFAMNSTEYAQGEWGKSYIGHRSNGWVRITPVPAILTLESAEWGHLDKDGTWSVTTTKDDKPGNRIKIKMNVRSAIGTAVTCKVPTGAVQISIDGKKFGQPIQLDKNWIEKDGVSTYTVKEGPTDESANTAAAIASPENRWTAEITYYMEPSQADALLTPKSALKTVSKSDESNAENANPFSTVFDAVTSFFAPAPANAAVEDVDETKLGENEYKLTGEYLPDKNYVEGVELNPQNADATATIIIPVDPATKITDDQGTTYEEKEITEPTGDEEGGLVGSDSEHKILVSSVTKNYSDFHKKDKDGNETIDKDYFTLNIETDSAMPITYVSSDPSVADFLRDSDGNVVLDENGNPKVEVFSCGKVKLVMHQDGNAVFNETSHVIDLTMIPDESLKPETEARVIERNLTHPGMPAAPGDVIEYTIVGTNYTDGSSWQDVDLGSLVSKHLTVNEDSFQVAKNFATPDDLDKARAEDFDDEDWAAAEDHSSTKNNVKGTTSVGTNLGSIYGGQSSAVRFTATVNSDIVDREAMEGDNPPTIPNEPTASGSYGVKETADLVPGEAADSGTSKPVKDTVLIGIPDTSKPDAQIIPRDPVMSGENAEMYVNKVATNTTRDTGVTLPGDTVRYDITIGNKAKDTCLYYPVIHDALPEGITPVMGTFELTHPDGTKTKVDDKIYTKGAHTVALYVDDLYGGEEATLTFECTVSDKAKAIENSAQVIGTLPSDKYKDDKKKDDNPTNPTVTPEKAIDILGGEFEDDPQGDDEGTDTQSDDPKEPGVPVTKVTDDGPFSNALKADPEDPAKTADPTDPEDPESIPQEPIKPGDVIVKFGEKEPPAGPSDIADELERIIKEKLAEDPEADSVDVPVTIKRPNPDDPTAEPETINVIVRVPIDPEDLTPGTPDIDKKNPPEAGDPWTPDPKIPTEDYPWDDFKWEDYVGEGGIPENHTDEPVTPGIFVPVTDPKVKGDDADLKVTKTAENVDTHKDGKTYVGDTIRYTITVANEKEGTCWFNAIVRDDLPKGLDIDMSTAKIILADGQEVLINEQAFNAAEHMLLVNVGDVEGGKSLKVVFEASINDEAINSDLGNKATAYGKKPSDVTAEELAGTGRPHPGTPATVPEPGEGGDGASLDDLAIETVVPVYPEDVEKNGVQPANDDVKKTQKKHTSKKSAKDSNDNGAGAASNNGGGNGNSGTGDDYQASGVSNPVEWLAQTGDPIMLTLIGAGAVAVIAIATIVIVRRKNRK